VFNERIEGKLCNLLISAIFRNLITSALLRSFPIPIFLSIYYYLAVIRKLVCDSVISHNVVQAILVFSSLLYSIAQSACYLFCLASSF